ncbi:MAG TPA: DHH family phosphoesterase [Anaerolineaceae bacterium]|jgi:phosphoesterase RecJ-like protein
MTSPVPSKSTVETAQPNPVPASEFPDRVSDAFAIGESLRQAQQVLIVSHVRPDGDAIGSLLGLGLSLQVAGKKVQMVLADGVPMAFRHLAGSAQITKQPKGPFDLVTVVDASDLSRVGKALEGLPAPDVNIDHHITNLNFARLNLVEPKSVATSAILAERLPEWGLPVTPEIASALLTGIISDTLGFRTSNMTAKTLRLAANLMEIGTDMPELYNRALVRRSFAATRYWAIGLNRMERQGRLVWTSLTQADRAAIDYPGNDDADLINILSSIEEIDVAVIFVEQRGGKVKISWRAVPGINVSAVALTFGGGGHAAAAGAEIHGSLAEVREKVLKATSDMLELV